MSSHNLLGRTIFSFIALVLVTEAFSACRRVDRTDEEHLRLWYSYSEIVAVGQSVVSARYGQGNFKVEGICNREG